MLHNTTITINEGRSSAAATPILSFAALLCCFLFLAGCATTPEENDPAEGGFWRAVQGVSGGQYEERQRRQEEDLASQQDISRRLEQRHEEIMHDQARLDEQIQYYQKKVDEVELQIAKAHRKLSELDDENEEARRILHAAETRLSKMRQKLYTEEKVHGDEILNIMKEIGEIERLVADLTASFG